MNPNLELSIEIEYVWIENMNILMFIKNIFKFVFKYFNNIMNYPIYY
jgi:hypothetical protein